MGKKQQALINDLAMKQTACDIQINKINTAIDGVQAINLKILNAGNNVALCRQLTSDKNPLYGEMLKAKVQLEKGLVAAFEDSLKALDSFAKEKAKRWLGKSTLKDAQSAVADAKVHLANMKQIIEVSRGII